MKKRVFSSAPVLLLAVLAACSNPVSSGEHVRPSGLSVWDNGTEVIRVMGTDTAAFSIAAGSETPLLAVRFLDAQGEFITPSSDYFLNVQSSTAAAATWQETAAGAFSGRISAVAPGVTTLRFRWMHGVLGSGHEDRRYHVAVTVTGQP